MENKDVGKYPDINPPPLPGQGEDWGEDRCRGQGENASTSVRVLSRQSALIGSRLLPWLIMVVCLWGSYESLRVAIADLLYPQQQVLRRSHWVHRAERAEKKRRLQQALHWTSNNGWYWHSLARLEAEAARHTLRASPVTMDIQRQAKAKLHQAAAWYRRALLQRLTAPATQLAWLNVLHDIARLDVARARDRNEELETLASRITTLAPTNPFVQYTVGYLILSRHNGVAKQASALPFFRQAIHLDVSYMSKVLQAYLTYFPEAKAVSRFVHAIPPTQQGHLKAAQALEDKDWYQARRQYLAALTLDPENPNILQPYGTALLRHRAFTAAWEVWARLREVNQDDPTAYLGLADAYRGLDNTTAEIQILQAFVTRFPRRVASHRRLAEAYGRLGQTAEAEAEWKALIAIRPQSVAGYIGLTRLYESQQDYATAVAMMQQVVNMAPGTISHHRYLARLYEKHGRRARALEEYERMAALRPDNPAILYELGEYFRQAGDLQRAIDYYRQAQGLDPQRALYFRQMGKAYAVRRNHRQAIEAYQHATTLEANNAATYYALGRSYEAMGAEEPARRAYGKAVDLAPEQVVFRRALEKIGKGEIGVK